MTGTCIYQVLADGVVILHLFFIVFVILGGMLVLVRPKIIWLHIPCVIWGILIELTGGICPLTPLELYLRTKTGESAYTGDFVIHYIEPIIYPGGLTRELQILFSIAVIMVNTAVYTWVFLRHKKKR
ncbi:MAG TPA: DUF2784 domain-containing protein [Deltaproteobacteria bacterium]|nr:DUF2784 domain-containing protein [Deltaproteobacteria bacterium]HPJ95024.1 DUF2784 domain-containing protein [Deltaproteobacteria bacterium]HPR52654.1 DUF2784 domain-containing protein [Deltaproteobacteria bacterium]